jgi:hypothetical protein
MGVSEGLSAEFGKRQQLVAKGKSIAQHSH